MRISAPRACSDLTPGFDAEAGRTAAITFCILLKLIVQWLRLL